MYTDIQFFHSFFFFNDTATTEIYTLSLHDALPILETRQAKENHALQAEQLNNSVQAAYVQYQQTYIELETQRKSVELAQQNYEVMNARYLSQLALVTDMVDASNLKLNAELSEVDARINIVYAYYRMKYVAGEI